MNSDWTIFVTIAGLLFGTAVSIHFLTVKRPGIAIRWLGWYTLVMTISLAEYIVPENSSVLALLGGLTFLYGPFLFLYVTARITGVFLVGRKTYKHFIPFCIYFLLLLASPMLINENNRAGYDLAEFIVYELLFFQIFRYCIAAMRFIRRNQSLLKEEDPDLGKMKIAFLRILVIVSITLFAASFLGTHIFMLIGFQLPFEFKYGVQIALCLLIFVIALLNTETMHAKKLVKAYSL